jgi:hypothetical protein
MESNMRKMIDQVKNFKQSINENNDMSGYRPAKLSEINKNAKLFVKLNGEIVPVTIKNMPDPKMDFETVVKLPDGSEDVFTSSSFLMEK